MKRLLLLPGLLLMLATPAQADVDGKTTSNQTIQMESVALPVIVNGALINYVFVSIRLELMPKADGAAVRAKEQFFRDDLVRTGHRAPFPFTRFDDYTKVDEAKVRAEILRAAQAFEGTTEDEFRGGLYAPDMHDPELLIRTGGERRLSNYLLWQVAESELVFSDELWPDFSRGSFEEAIAEFRRRKVR